MIAGYSKKRISFSTRFKKRKLLTHLNLLQLILALLIFNFKFSLGSEEDCPWFGDPEIPPNIKNQCICARNPNSNNQLSVQCQDVDGPEIISILSESENQPLELLYLNGSSVTEKDGLLPKGFLLNLKLISLQLSGCGIKRLELGALEGQGVGLKHLSLTGNLLHEVPTQALRPLTQLTLLDLSFNKISKIPASAFETLQKLSTLKLNDNQLEFHPKAFNGLEKSLRNLNLKGTRISSIPEAISKLSNLAFLDLAQNRMRELEGGLNGLESLTALNLERNLLQSLPDSAFLGVNKTLSSLSLLNNLITHFPKKALLSLKELRVLDLGFNLLTEIPLDAFSGLKSLTLLALDGNPLASLPYQAFSSLNSTLRGLSLGGRFLSCDCRIQWVGHWIRDYDLQVTSRERNPQFCGTPNQFRQLNFYQIRTEDFICEKNETNLRTTSSKGTTTTTTARTTRITSSTPSPGPSSSKTSYEIQPTSDNLALLGHGTALLGKQFIPKTRVNLKTSTRSSSEQQNQNINNDSSASLSRENNASEENDNEDKPEPPISSTAIGGLGGKYRFRPRPLRPRLRPKFNLLNNNNVRNKSVVLEVVDPTSASGGASLDNEEIDKNNHSFKSNSNSNSKSEEIDDEIDEIVDNVHSPSNSSPVEKTFTDPEEKPSTYRPSTYRPLKFPPINTTPKSALNTSSIISQHVIRKSPPSIKQFSSLRPKVLQPVTPTGSNVGQIPGPKVTSSITSSTRTSISTSVSTSLSAGAGNNKDSNSGGLLEKQEAAVIGRGHKESILIGDRQNSAGNKTIYRADRKPITKVTFDTGAYDESKIPVITGVGPNVRPSTSTTGSSGSSGPSGSSNIIPIRPPPTTNSKPSIIKSTSFKTSSSSNEVFSTTSTTTTNQPPYLVHQLPSSPLPSFNARPPNLIFADKTEKSEILVKEVERTGDSVYIYWESYKSPNGGGFRIIYRFFGEENFRQGPPLSATEREYRIRNLPNDQCIIVCVVPLYEEILYTESIISNEMPTGSQCKELKASTPSVLMYNMDKITIGASAAICGTVMLAVIIFIAVTRRGKGKRSHSAMISKVLPPSGLLTTTAGGHNIGGPQHPGAILNGSCGLVKEWDTLSVVSARSIPRARVYHNNNNNLNNYGSSHNILNDQLNGQLNGPHRSTLLPQRTTHNNNGDSSRSYLSTHHAHHNHSFHAFGHPSNSSSSSMNHQLQQHHSSHTHLNTNGHHGGGNSYLNNQSRILRASMGSTRSSNTNKKQRQFEQNHNHHQKSSRSSRKGGQNINRLSHSESVGTLSGYETPGDQNWTDDHDLDVYIGRNHTTRHNLHHHDNLVQL